MTHLLFNLILNIQMKGCLGSGAKVNKKVWNSKTGMVKKFVIVYFI